MKLVNGFHQVTSKINILPFEGHTPGHQCVWITGENEKSGAKGAIFIGDALHHRF